MPRVYGKLKQPQLLDYMKRDNIQPDIVVYQNPVDSKDFILPTGLPYDLGDIGIVVVESNVYSPIPMLIIFSFCSAATRDAYGS